MHYKLSILTDFLVDYLTGEEMASSTKDVFILNTGDGRTGSNSQAIILGVVIPLAIVIAVVFAIIIAVIIYFCYAQYKLKDSMKVNIFVVGVVMGVVTRILSYHYPLSQIVETVERRNYYCVKSAEHFLLDVAIISGFGGHY